MQCGSCGQELVPGGEFCGNCGAKIVSTPVASTPQAATAIPQQPAPANATTIEPAQQQTGAIASPQQSPQPVPAVQANSAYAVPKETKSGMSIAALILGIVALLSSFFWLIAIPTGILAIIFGIIGATKGTKGLGIAGIVLGSLGIVASIVIITVFINYCDSNPEVEDCEGVSTRFVPRIEL